MHANSIGTRSFGKSVLMLGIGTLTAMVTGHAMAGCGMYDPLAPPPVRAVPAPGPDGFMPALYQPGAAQFVRTDYAAERQAAEIVGLWKFTLTSDGTAYPAPIPFGAPIDFGTAQWHSDGTELMVSGGRPPSTGNVCMGVWKQTGPRTYELTHVTLGWVSADTPPSQGGPFPAAFQGPGTIHEKVKLSRSGDSFEGTFTIDQFAQNGITLIEHISGTVNATRVTAD